MAGRYPGSRVWDAHSDSPLPADVAAHPSGRAGESVFWIPQHRALVVGDVLVGDGDGGLKLGRGTGAREVEALRPLVDLEPALVLTSHGEPPEDAASALVAVLRLDG
jgi:glyoxylase-like metal-dependent hydrolase (beta-lactamase superfamily II)